jgi:hypothetical protein
MMNHGVVEMEPSTLPLDWRWNQLFPYGGHPWVVPQWEEVEVTVTGIRKVGVAYQHLRPSYPTTINKYEFNANHIELTTQHLIISLVK